jgi:hypothetical protein
MSTRSPTFDKLKAPIDLPTGEHHRIVLPPRPVRARLVGILFETDKTFVLPLTGHRGKWAEATAPLAWAFELHFLAGALASSSGNASAA